MKRSASGTAPRTTIGWVELVELVDWGITLRGKIDTGAKNSALHVEGVRLLRGDLVRFTVVVDLDKGERRQVETKVVRRGRVKPSSGHAQDRVFVATRVRLGEVVKVAELSLVSRERMRYRMLVGRSFLSKSFVVDVSRRFLLGKGPTTEMT